MAHPVESFIESIALEALQRLTANDTIVRSHNECELLKAKAISYITEYMTNYTSEDEVSKNDPPQDLVELCTDYLYSISSNHICNHR